MFTTVSTCSSTAHRPFGHMGAIGAGSVRITDRQAEAVAELLAERARRALYASCDRAPFNWELFNA